jgi:hypothetical protein
MRPQATTTALSDRALEKTVTGIQGLDEILARGDQILAVPTLVRKLPEPVKKIIGDLSNTERVLVGLDLRPVGGEMDRLETGAGDDV